MGFAGNTEPQYIMPSGIYPFLITLSCQIVN